MTTIYITDTKTNQTIEAQTGDNLFYWKSGNGSCDCNRAIYFPEADSELEQKYHDTCYGALRFLITDIKTGPLGSKLSSEQHLNLLLELNSDYDLSSEQKQILENNSKRIK